MNTTLDFDEQTARQVEAVYRTPDVIAQRDAIRKMLAPRPREHVLDIGSGPGFLAMEIAKDVGPEGIVHGVDISESMIAIARRREPATESAPLQFQLADARTLPFPDASFDAAVSTQVFEYIDDVPAALAEAHRVLTPGGRLLLLDTDWDSIVWHSREPQRMRRVLAAWDAHAADPHLPRTLPGLIRDAGFTLTDTTVMPLFNRRYDPDTYSAGVTPIIAAFVAGQNGITADQAASWAQELTELGDRYFFSLNRYVFLATT
jgi:arsenite methyltransferase